MLKHIKIEHTHQKHQNSMKKCWKATKHMTIIKQHENTINAYVCVCMYVVMYVCRYVCMYVRIMHVCDVYVCMYLRMYTYVYVCL